MKKKLILSVVLLTAVMLFAGSESPTAGEKRDPKGPPAKKMYAELGITPEQEAKLKDIRTQSAAAARIHIKQIEVLQEKINAELLKDKPSKSALNKYAAEIGKIHGQMNQAFVESRLKTKTVLTPEQYARLSERGFIGGQGPGGPGMGKRAHRSPDGEKFAGKHGRGPGYGHGHGHKTGPGGPARHGDGQYKGKESGHRHHNKGEARDQCPHKRKFERSGDNQAAPAPESGEGAPDGAIREDGGEI